MIEVAGFFMSILSVFATLLKSHFFVIYYRGVTLADDNVGEAVCLPWDGKPDPYKLKSAVVCGIIREIAKV